MNRKYFLLAIGFGTLVLAFQNCSKMNFEESSLAENSTDNVMAVLTKCNNAEAQNKLMISHQTIRFEDSHQETGRSQVCEFGVGDNLSQSDEVIRARYEQSRSLSLPANAVICDIEMTTQLQRFRYDDVFILTFNDRVLATNNRTALRQRNSPESTIKMSDSSEVALYKYNWLNLRNAPFTNTADDYCIGSEQNKSYCTWPISEQSGNIRFEFDPELLVHLGLRAKSQDAKFGFIVTGDDDPTIDCGHETLEFNMKVKYYVQ